MQTEEKQKRGRRIAFVDLLFHWPPQGGSWVDLHALMTGLQQRDWEVKLFVPSWTDYFPRGEINTSLPFPVERIAFNRFTFNASLVRRRFQRAIRRWGPDMVFVGDGYSLKPHLVDALAGDYPTVCRFYAYEVLCINLHYWLYQQNSICDGGFLQDPARCQRCWFPRGALLKRSIKIALKWPDTYPSLHFSQEYIAALGFTNWYRRGVRNWLSKAKALVVYNQQTANLLAPIGAEIRQIPSGVDCQRFYPTDTPPQHPTPRILVPGRFDSLKGTRDVIMAARNLRQQGLACEVLLTGDRLPDITEDWITFTGWLPPEQMPELYRSADIVAVPSHWAEPFGITVLEAMASGLPVVGACTGGIQETLVDGETGYHFEPGEVNQLADCLRTLLEDPGLRRRMGVAGRSRAQVHYDWNHILEKDYLAGILAS